MKKIFFLFSFFPFFLFTQERALINPDYQIILVKLKTNQTQLSFLRDSGFVKSADSRQEYLNQKNRDLQRAFTHFTHCPVYFFYSHHTDSVLKSLFPHRYIFDSLNQSIVDTQHIRIIHDRRYLIGELGYLSNNQLGIPSFFLSNAQNKPLQKPFPYYVRSHVMGVPSSFDYMIRRLQSKLEKK